MKRSIIFFILALSAKAGLIAQGNPFVPDLSKAYYIDCPASNLRLAANGGSQPYTTSTSTEGSNVQWRFVPSSSAGYYFIECDGGGAAPRIRSDQTPNANMVGITAAGSWVQWITDSADNGAYFLTTLQESDYDMLQIDAGGDVKIVDNTNTGTDVQFTFSEVQGAVSERSTYYVSKSGDDGNEGSYELPFLTINKAAMLAKAGDTVFIQEGRYNEILNPANSGIPGKPIVFTAYAGDSVLISATEALSGWELHEGSVYKASANMPLGYNNILFFEGKAMDRARWPNNSDGDIYTVEGHSVSGGSASTITTDAIPDLDWSGGYVWYLGAHSGASWTRPITATTATSVSFPEIDISKWPFSTHNPTVYRNNNRGQFFLFGVLDALDYEQEWFFDDSEDSVYFYAPEGVDPTGSPVEAAVRTHTILINQSYIEVKGIDAFGGKVEVSGSNCRITGGEFLDCLQVPDELNNTSAQLGNGAFVIAGSNTLIDNNLIQNSSINGIYIQGWGGVSNIEIRNNYILNCNSIGIHASPIRSGASNSKIISNTIVGTGRDGIYCSSTNNEIAYNDVSECMRINNDGGIYYTVGNDGLKNTEIHHNWFHDSDGPFYADGRVAGIYLDNDSKGYSVHHNVVWNITWRGLQINWYNTHIDFFHNTLWNTSAAIGRWDNNYDEHDNRVWNNFSKVGDWRSVDFEPDLQSNKISGTSLLIDIPGHNFIPQANSALVDMAVPIDNMNDDFLGTAPDIGAYERGYTPWIPGVHTVYGGEIDSLNYNYLRNGTREKRDSISTDSEAHNSFYYAYLTRDSLLSSFHVLDTLIEEDRRNDTLFSSYTYIDSLYTKTVYHDSTYQVNGDSLYTYFIHAIADTIFYDSILVGRVLTEYEASAYTSYDTTLTIIADTVFLAADSVLMIDTLINLSYFIDTTDLTGFGFQTYAEEDVLLYPNPLSGGELHLSLGAETEVTSILIFDAGGHLLYRRDNFSLEEKLPSSIFPEAGVYVLHLRMKDFVAVKRVVVR